MDVEKIEGRIDSVVASQMPVSRSIGGIAVNTMSDVFEMAKYMAISGVAVPKHLRANPGTCLAVCIQALDWGIPVFAVANKSYSVNDRLAYESQLIHAVVEARAPLEKRLRESYEGEGEERRCTVTGTLKGDATPFTVTSPKIKDIGVKNSPLWKSDPDQQLFYYTTRSWARRYVPDVLLGIYTADELADVGEGPSGAVDVTPQTGLAQRLAAKEGTKGRALDPANIDRALEHKPAQTVDEVVGETKKQAVPVEATPEQSAKSKRSHHKKREEPANEAGKSDEVETGDSGGAGEATLSDPAPAEDAGTGVETSEPVDGSETEEEPQADVEEEPSAAVQYADELMVKVEAHLASGEIRTADDFKAYKAETRKIVDGLEGLTADQTDLLRGKFTTMMLNAERDLLKRGKRR